MRIISKFKDFYDSASAYGVDMEKIYQRESRTEKLHLEYSGFGGWNVTLDKYDVIGFCGKIYPILNEADSYDPADIRKQRILYGEDAIKFEKNKIYPNIEHPSNKEPFFIEDETLNSSWRNPKECYDDLVNSKKLLSLFEEHKTPIFWISKNGSTMSGKDWRYGMDMIININPNLKDLCFFKVKDSVQAFAEIHQYLDVIQSQDTQVDVPVGDNTVVGKSKGFDANSFRKEPTKKKYSKKSKTKKL